MAEYLYLLWSYSDPIFEVIKGHVTTGEALNILNQEGINNMVVWSNIKQTYGRWVPTPHNPDVDMMFVPVSEPARGAFPVTILYYT